MERNLFVYGTLRKNVSDWHHVLARDATFLGEGRFRGRLYDLGMYPGVVASAHYEKFVKGEVYALHHPELTVQYLDEYEGCRGLSPLYSRQLANIVMAEREVKAWIYIYNHSVEDLKFIPSGDYVEYLVKLRGRCHVKCRKNIKRTERITSTSL